MPGLLFDMLVTGAVAESRFRELSREQQLALVLDDWQTYDLVARDETLEFVSRSSQVWQVNRDATAHDNPDRIRALSTSSAPPVPSTMAWPAIVVRRVHECDAARDGTRTRLLASGLRELLGWQGIEPVERKPHEARVSPVKAPERRTGSTMLSAAAHFTDTPNIY